MRLSLEARLALVLLALVAGVCAGAVALARAIEAPGLAWLIAVSVAVPISLVTFHLSFRPVTQWLAALADSARRLREADFSLSLVTERKDELGDLARLYNELGEAMRRERQHLYQREMLLDTVIQATPIALLLVDDTSHVIYSNAAARQLFANGRKLEGLVWTNAVAGGPAELVEALARGEQGIVNAMQNGEPETFQVAQSPFTLNTRPHQLHLLNRLTRELTRQELQTWKKVIRVLSHELGNSLAPISSLAHSLQHLPTVAAQEPAVKALATIEERAIHLTNFLEEYARFARLPKPRLAEVNLETFVEELRGVVTFRLEGHLPQETGRFDPAQLGQALINLLKNGGESGSPREAVTLEVVSDPIGLLFRVRDRGPGMSEEVLRNAMLPFYTTKASGSGLGLALCRDIAEAHGGRLALSNIPGGGLEVRMWVPRDMGEVPI